jgi:hypothetical protein
MQMHGPDMTDTPPRRGRPPTGIRKTRVQVMLDPGDAEALEAAAVASGKPIAEIGRALIKGEMTWGDVTKAARKGARR